MPVLKREKCLHHSQQVEHLLNLRHNQIEGEEKSVLLQVGQIGGVGVEVQVAAASRIHHLDLVPYRAPDLDRKAGRHHHHPSLVPLVPAASAPLVARVLPPPVEVQTRSISIVTLLVLQAHVVSHPHTDLKIKREDARKQYAAAAPQTTATTASAPAVVNRRVVKFPPNPILLCPLYLPNHLNLTVDREVANSRHIHRIIITTITITTTITNLVNLPSPEQSMQDHLAGAEAHQRSFPKLKIL